MRLRDRIRQAPDIPSKKVYVPEWDVTLLIKGINGTERGEMDKLVRKASKDENVNFLQTFVWPLLQLTLCDPDTGVRLYEATDSDRDELLARNDLVLYRLFTEAQTVCAVAPESKDEAKEDFGLTP